MRTRVMLSVICLAAAAYAAGSEYEDMEFNLIKAAPESISSNKKIVYSAPFIRYSTTFPRYMEESGFKSSKYYLLEIGHASVPAILRKNTENNELVASLKRGAVLKVYGRVKKFKDEPHVSMLPHYYFSADKLEVVAQGKDEPEGGNTPRIPRRPIHRPRGKR